MGKLPPGLSGKADMLLGHPGRSRRPGGADVFTTVEHLGFRLVPLPARYPATIS